MSKEIYIGETKVAKITSFNMEETPVEHVEVKEFQKEKEVDTYLLEYLEELIEHVINKNLVIRELDVTKGEDTGSLKISFELKR